VKVEELKEELMNVKAFILKAESRFDQFEAERADYPSPQE
jgi:hypothetical protein